MFAANSTVLTLVIVVYSMMMGANFAWALIAYHRNIAIWKGNLTVGVVMLLMMIMSLL